MAPASPFMRSLDLEAHGVPLLHSPAACGHPLQGRPAALAWRDLDATCAGLGRDGQRWRRPMLPLMERSADVVDLMLSTQRTPPNPKALALLATRLPAQALRVGGGLRTEAARALLTGVAAHGIGRLPSPASAAVALLLGHLAHTTGWPVPQGGSQAVAAVMARQIERLGGRIHTGVRVDDLRDRPPAGSPSWTSRPANWPGSPRCPRGTSARCPATGTDRALPRPTSSSTARSPGPTPASPRPPRSTWAGPTARHRNWPEPRRRRPGG